MKEQNLHGYFLRVSYIKRNINNSAARSHHLHDLMQDAPKFSWARTSLSSKWQGELSIALLIRTANTRSPCWLMKLATRALTATLKPPTSFKQTGTLWSCNAEHIEVQLCGLVCKTQTWQGTRQTWSSFTALWWLNAHPRRARGAELPAVISRLPASSWMLLCLKSESSSLSHYTETLTDANVSEESLLTGSLSSRSASEWVLQQMCSRLHKLHRSLSLWAAVASHLPPASAKQKIKTRKTKQNTSLLLIKGKES